MKRGSRGFTLVESLVVLAILIVLGTVALGVRAVARRGHRKEICRDHLHRIGEASTAYEAKYARYPSPGPKRWFRDLWDYGVVSDPGIFRCPYVGEGGPRTDYMGLPTSGSAGPPSGAHYSWTASGITDGAPPDLPMACDGDTPAGPNHGTEDVHILFFQGRVDSFPLRSPTEGKTRGTLVPSSLQWAAPVGTK